MTRNIVLALLLLALIFAGSAPALAQSDDPDWEMIIPGIEYRHFELPDPNNVFVTRMDRNNPNVILDSTIAGGNLAEGRETVSEMYARYDQALNFWGGSTSPHTWGMRNQVIVAINGSYFDFRNGIPQGGQVQSGWYVKRYDKLGGWGGFAYNLDRSVFISECLDHNPDKQFITYPEANNVQQIKGINVARENHGVYLYTPQYNSRTGTDDAGVEVVVEMNQPTMIFPGPAYISGFVRQIHVKEGNNLIPFNSIVLSAKGNSGQELLGSVEPGSEIRITQEITSYDADCATPYYLHWTKTYASLQGAFFYLQDGQIKEYDDPGATKRNPRTAIAFNDQYIYFIVVDGRDLLHSVGMTIPELGEFTRDLLGANWGVAQDGGGSSTMVINGQVVNNTYCNLTSCAGYSTPYEPVDVHERYNPTDDASESVSADMPERAVANGMLMVVARPAVYSTSFRPDDTVRTIYDTEMRLGPGTNYESFTVIPSGTQGTIIPQMNGLDGVLAKSSYWWYVNFNGEQGWVPEEALENPWSGTGMWDLFIHR